MTTTTEPAIGTPPATDTSEIADEIVLLARVGGEQHALTAAQVRDTVASYLATGGHMPTPRHGDGTDPHEPLHIITEQWLWSNPIGWVHGADRVQLATYRHEALTWINGFFGAAFPDLDD
ncbi:MAG: hypothetical protein GEV09_08360 [Pseudonocardiaceae bacterium]|nr:hypothetical protein [Pseudonocardiaceae bacterium]